MFSSIRQSNVETLARSDSEIEVNFARHQNGDKVTGRKEEENASEAVFKRSFTTTFSTILGQNSQEDTEGSSIIDLRTKKSNQRRSRSLDNLEERQSKQEGKKSHLSNRRSLNNPPVRKPPIGYETRMSFHSSLQDLSSDDQQTAPFNFDPKDNNWNRRQSKSRKNSRKGGRKGDSPSAEFPSSPELDKWESKSGSRCSDHQIFMKKPLKFQEKFGKKTPPDRRASPPCSPTFSFRSSLNNLIPSCEKKKGIRQQIIVTIASSLAPLACGFAIAYLLTTKSQKLESLRAVAGWTHYIFILGGLVGAFVSGIASNFGRKFPMFFAASLLMLAWIAIIFASQTWTILLFYGLSGGCTSVILVLSQMYIAEISVPSVRGSLSSTPLLSLHIGVLLCFLLSKVLEWNNLAVVGVSLIGPFFIMLVLCMPESPRFLIHKNPNEALSMLQWLRGFNTDIVDEYRDLADNCYADRWTLDISDFTRPSFWRPLLISSTLMFLYSMSGIASIALYGQSLFEEMSVEYPFSSYIVITSIILIGIIISSLLVDQVGRKLLLLLSLTIMAASSFALGLFLFLKDVHKVETYFLYQWAAELFCIILFTLAHGSAVAPIAWLTLGEIFGTRLRWIGVSLSSMVMWGSMLLVDLAYHRISIVIATGGLFWFHCIICVGGYIFILLFFRELRDHKMDDVAKVFLKKNENLIDTFITKI